MELLQRPKRPRRLVCSDNFLEPAFPLISRLSHANQTRCLDVAVLNTHLDITPEEALAFIPTEGVMLADLAKSFKGRLGKGNLQAFKAMVKTVSIYDSATQRFMPM